MAAKTTIVHFQDVKHHWNRVTRQWDSDQYVYIGRVNFAYNLPPSKWANHFSVSKYGRTEAIKKYRKRLLYTPGQPLLADIEELRGKTLVCWCKQQDSEVACHGDVLIELLEQSKGEKHETHS